jgi:hypothetical protein
MGCTGRPSVPAPPPSPPALQLAAWRSSSQEPTWRSSFLESPASRRSVPAPLPSPPPTQPPAPRSRSPKRPTSGRLSSAPRLRYRFVYVAVPPRSQKRALPPSDVSSDIANSVHGAPKDLTLNERHPEFLHTAKKFLLSVSESCDWRILLLNYAEFERLAVRFQFSHTLHSNLTGFSGPWETLNFLAS